MRMVFGVGDVRKAFQEALKRLHTASAHPTLSVPDLNRTLCGEVLGGLVRGADSTRPQSNLHLYSLSEALSYRIWMEASPGTTADWAHLKKYATILNAQFLFLEVGADQFYFFDMFTPMGTRSLSEIPVILETLPLLDGWVEESCTGCFSIDASGLDTELLKLETTEAYFRLLERHFPTLLRPVRELVASLVCPPL